MTHGGAQCGICTPGIRCSPLVTSSARATSPGSESDVRHALAGNLCRCTGCMRIFEAVLQAQPWREGVGLMRSAPPAFDLRVPAIARVKQLTLMAEPEAPRRSPLAGGADRMVLLEAGKPRGDESTAACGVWNALRGIAVLGRAMGFRASSPCADHSLRHVHGE